MYGEYDSARTHPSSQDEDSGHFRNTLPHTGKKKRASRLGKAGLKYPKHPEFKQLSLSESGEEVHELTNEDSNSQSEPGMTSVLSWLRETPVKNDEPIKSQLSPPFKTVNTIHRSTSIHTEKSSVISELISGSLPAGNLNTFPELKTEKPSNLSVPSWKRSLLFKSCDTKPPNILQDVINFDNNAHRTALSDAKLVTKNSVETEPKVTDKENVIPKLFVTDKSSDNLFNEHKTKQPDTFIGSHTVQTSNRSSQLIKEIIHENLNTWETKRIGEHYHSTNNELIDGPASNEMHSFNLSKNKVLEDPGLPFDLRISSRMNSEHAYSCGPSVNSHSLINSCHKSDNSQKGFLPLSSSNDIVDTTKPCSVGENVQTKHNFLPTNSLHVSKPVYNFFFNKSEPMYTMPRSNHVSSSSNVFDNDKISNSGCNEFNKDTNIKSSPEIFTSNEYEDKLSPLNVQTSNKISPVKIQPVRTDDKQLSAAIPSAISVPSVSQQKPKPIPMPSVSQQKPIGIPVPSVSQQKPIAIPMPSVSQQKPTAIPMPSVPQQKPIMAPPSSTNTFKPPQSVLKTSRSTLLRTQSHNRFNPEYNVTNDSSGKTISVNDKPYAILSILGKGGSSEVFLVLEQETTKLKAIKCVNLSKVDKIIADGYLNEVELLLKLQGCESVIRMFDHEYIEDEKLLYVVMEKGDTDLSKLLREISKTKKVSLPMIIYYWTEMLSVVKDIHDRGIIHSDLKPANFLLVGGRLKLIDFGIASSLQGDMTSVQKEVTTGTWNYMSPEALKNNGHTAPGFKINYKSDVWSLGCILYNLVYGKTPFSHITKSWGKLLAIVDPSHVISFPETVEGRGSVPIFLLKTLKDCLTRDPKLRPSVTDLLNCPYYQITDDNNVENHTRKLKNEMAEKIKNILSPENFREIAHIFEPSPSTNVENSV